MRNRPVGDAKYGPWCPDDKDRTKGHGRLLKWRDQERWYCPHQDHTGTGKFFTDADLTAAGNAPSDLWVDEPQVIRIRQVVHAEPDDTRTDTPNATPVPARTRERAPDGTGPECLCGCGERTKGGRFRPGHDARYHARMKAQHAAQDSAGA